MNIRHGARNTEMTPHRTHSSAVQIVVLSCFVVSVLVSCTHRPIVATKPPVMNSPSSAPTPSGNRPLQEKEVLRLQALRQAIAQTPNDPDLYYQAGLLEEQQGRWDQALKDYQTAVQLDPEFLDAHYHAGLVWEQMGEMYYLGKSRVVTGPQRRKAIEAYLTTIRINPEFADGYYRLGLAYLMGGELRQASAACQELYRLEPDSRRTRQLVQRIYDWYQNTTRNKKR